MIPRRGVFSFSQPEIGKGESQRDLIGAAREGFPSSNYPVFGANCHKGILLLTRAFFGPFRVFAMRGKITLQNGVGESHITRGSLNALKISHFIS